VIRRAGIAGELIDFLWNNKRWWILPMVIFIFAFGVVFALAQNAAIAPFIYSLF
jgi:hypothetical protein